MDQRSLIEIHSALSADGWQIKVEMTDRTRKGKVCSYLLSHPKLHKGNLEVILTYPLVSKSGKYELVGKDEHQIISSIFYTTETEAQFALLETCNKLTEGAGVSASHNNTLQSDKIAGCAANFDAER